ncbi:MAG TPA: hypothetical protein PLE43_09210 [Alphaproteobacteria bacterium]|nr:hypothetical protein [Alphaproteobacteria bacterium]
MGKLIVKIISFLVLGFSLSYVFWVYKPGDLIPVQTFLFLTMPLAIITVFLIEHIVTERLSPKPVILPRLRAIANDKYLFEPSPLFSNLSWVSLYLIDDYEQLVGIGYVESVLQEKKTLQVVIAEFHADYDPAQIQNKKNRIVLKPSVPYPYAQFVKSSEGENNDQ